MSEIISSILTKSGTGQEQRYITALDPDNFDLHDFTIEDWILFAYNFSEHLNYFSTNNHEIATGNWKNFFKKLTTDEIPNRGTRDYDKLKENISEAITQFTNEAELTPHLTLFVCFLQLLEFSKERFNYITKRHLEFYYKEILQVDKRAPISDQAHVVFEIAKKITEQKIEKGTALDAKKDTAGSQLTYATNEDIIVNKTKVGALKNVFNTTYINKDETLVKEIKVSAIANTADGIEEPLSEEDPYWYPFGYSSEEENKTELQNAVAGFSIASPILALKEGYRKVVLRITFDTNFGDDTFQANNLIDCIKLYASGAEKWIEPELTYINDTNDGSIDFEKEVRFTFHLGHDVAALTNYNSEFLLESYNTTHPLVRFVFDISKDEGYDFYKFLAENTVKEITINTNVTGVKNAVVENDNGVLKTKKPFNPFTTRPIKGANFSMNYAEAFEKKWTNFNINLQWKNTPDDFTTWYEGYVQKSSYTSIETYAKELGKDNSVKQLIVADETHFKAEKRVIHAAGEAKEINDVTINLFTKETEGIGDDAQIIYTANIATENTSNAYGIAKAEAVQLSLKNSFLHDLYPRLYAKAISSEDKTIDLPNEPYIPLIESISVDYIAEETLVLSEAIKEGNRIQLFHEHPFGQHEENYAIKKYQQEEKNIREIFDTDTIETFLVPRYCLGGHLFIGLENVVAKQNVSLLIQVLEGSENPLVPSFDENEKIDWSVLCDNKWKSLEENTIANNTDNFLKSGIVKFSIPREATNDNTLLPEGYVWLRARMNKPYDAVCKVIDIHAQAVLTTFKNNENEVSHLKDGLPSGTIKKMITRIPQIKSIAQPYNAFGGSQEETDDNFYRRISGRLRHKNRAITLWDYENLILQEFPEIYKAKCLNHTSATSFSAAGNVTLIVVPDTVNKNVFNMFQPRVSMATLNAITTYINSLNTYWVDALVINPNYEEVQIGLEVQFYEGYDENFYKEQLKTDITKFLSPWAFDDTKEVTFGVLLHKSVLIDYMEKLPYVDYLQNVKMNGDASIYKIEPSDPKSILVSHKEHAVSTVLTTCKGTKEIIKQTCQL